VAPAQFVVFAVLVQFALAFEVVFTHPGTT